MAYLKGDIGILFCSKIDNNPPAAIEHLKNNEKLYWSTIGFSIKRENFTYPLIGLIHISGDNVRYKCKIADIKPYESSHHQDSTKKPQEWIIEQKDYPRTNYGSTLVIIEIEPFYYETRELMGIDGNKVNNPPRGYQRITLP